MGKLGTIPQLHGAHSWKTDRGRKVVKILPQGKCWVFTTNQVLLGGMEQLAGNTVPVASDLAQCGRWAGTQYVGS